MADTAPIKPRRRGPSPLVAALLLVTFAVVAYVPALRAGFIIDDSVNVSADPRMGSVAGLTSIWTDVGGPHAASQYAPLTTTAFWAQHRYFGLEPKWYHAVNVLLHALNALVLWRLLRRLAVPGAWVAAIIFAVHPVHAETVAWVSELKSVLSTSFCLAAAWCFVGRAKGAIASPAADSPAGSSLDTMPTEIAPEAPSKAAAGIAPAGAFSYALSLLLFAAALLSKPSAALLPAALLIILWWKRSVDGRALAALAPMVVMAAASAGLAVYLETRAAAVGDTSALSLVEQWMLAGRTLGFYATTLAWPVDLAFAYPGFHLDATNPVDHVWSGGAAALLLVLLAASPWIGRGAFAALSIFVVVMAPITFVNVALARVSPVADHWVYLASVPLIALAAAAAVRLWWIGRGVQLRRMAVLVSMMCVGILGGLTWQRAMVFESSQTLWTDTVQRNPGSWIAHAELARLESAAARKLPDAEAVGAMAAAAAHYQHAIELRPGDSSLHVNLGELRLRQGLLDMAASEYRRAVELDPNAAMLRADLGAILLSQRHVGKAIEHLGAAVKLNPEFAPAHDNLGSALAAAGRRDEAISHFRKAVALDPRLSNARYNLANELQAANRLDEAISEYHAALQITPGSPAVLNNLGAALIKAGRPDQAIEVLGQANTLRAGDGTTLHNMSLAARAIGDLNQAIAFDEAAAEARPGDAEIHHVLGRLYTLAGRERDAIQQLRLAVALKPFFPKARADLALALATHPGTTPALAAEAAEHARRAALQSDRNDASILRTLSLALAANGLFDESIMAAVEAQAVVAAGDALAEVPP